jgi:hypothetical protein
MPHRKNVAGYKEMRAEARECRRDGGHQPHFHDSHCEQKMFRHGKQSLLQTPPWAGSHIMIPTINVNLATALILFTPDLTQTSYKLLYSPSHKVLPPQSPQNSPCTLTKSDD